MNVVLSQDVKGLGYRGDVVKVAVGYARNFLIPNGIGVLASPGQMAKAEKMRSERVSKHEEVMEHADKIAANLKDKVLTFKRKVSSGKKLFGGISEHDIADALKEQGKVEIDKSQVHLTGGHIKTVGEHSADVHLYEGKHVTIKVIVEAE